MALVVQKQAKRKRPHDGTNITRERPNGRGTPRAIQNSQESLRVLAARYGTDPNTVARWRKRESMSDVHMGPKEPSSTDKKMKKNVDKHFLV